MENTTNKIIERSDVVPIVVRRCYNDLSEAKMDEDEYYDPELDEPELDEDEYFEREQARKAECTCGAYQWSKSRLEFVQVADCCCGRT